ncbi:MAG: hypothetical protein EXS09_08325 [Gemmataceae bacterium]|nr:hypothetical protein [Gemmataceae bacterium]
MCRRKKRHTPSVKTNVVDRVGRYHADDPSALHVRSKLSVECWSRSPIRHLRTACVRIGARCSGGFPIALLAGLAARRNLANVLDGTLQSLLLLHGRSHLCRLATRMLAIVSHEVHIDQTFMRQAGNRLSEELFEKLGGLNAEVGERVMLAAQTIEFASTANPFDAGVQPLGLLDKGPNVTNGMVGVETLAEGLGDHPALRRFGKSQPRGGLGFGNNVIQGVHPARKVRFHKKTNAPLPIRE